MLDLTSFLDFKNQCSCDSFEFSTMEKRFDFSAVVVVVVGASLAWSRKGSASLAGFFFFFQLVHSFEF